MPQTCTLRHVMFDTLEEGASEGEEEEDEVLA